MATPIRYNLKTTGLSMVANCTNKSFVGIGVAGTFVGTLTPQISYDGGATWVTLVLTPYPSGTTITSITTTGSWFAAIPYSNNPLNNTTVLVKVTGTSITSGNPIVSISSAVGQSFADAYSTDAQIYQQQTSSANAANVITQAANAYHGWNLTTLTVTWTSAATPTAGYVQVKDGTTVIWEVDTALATGVNNITLPSGGLNSTPNNAMVITVAAGGSGAISNLNAEIHASD
jgi:hypothetical protein